MIFGTAGTGPRRWSRTEYLEAWGVPPDTPLLECDVPRLKVGLTSSGAPVLDRSLTVLSDPEAGIALALYGELYDAGSKMAGSVGEAIVRRYRSEGTAAFRELNGAFVLVLADARSGEVLVVRDHLGVEPLYFIAGPTGQVHFSTDLHRLRRFGGPDVRLRQSAVLRYLLFNYNPSADSFFEGIEKLRPGHLLRVNESGVHTEVFWKLSFADPLDRSPAEWARELRELISDAVRIRLEGQPWRPGAYLSGGTDSSSVVSLMSQALDQPVHTFSFRCDGTSYDESHFARAVSRHWKTSHHEVPFSPEDAALILDLVPRMAEPFSDVGIEVASFLLAREARGEVDYVLTGDGGDELFAGHPVYLADRVASWYGRIPRALRAPLGWSLQQLPDSTEKKSLTVKLQRFAYSFDFPAELEANRWRIYYKRYELERLLTDGWRAALDDVDPLLELRQVHAEADGPDALSRAIYGDYHTVVDFYLRRMELVRDLGFTARFPLLDYRLVQYAASIPSSLKVTSDAANKDLFRDAMRHVLPPEILQRKDKLGNSVPLKNWLRESPEVESLLQEHLSPAAVRERGIFEPDYVASLWKQHRAGRRNNSHRLWSLLVLEEWLQNHTNPSVR